LIDVLTNSEALIRLCAAHAIGLIAGFVAFGVSLYFVQGYIAYLQMVVFAVGWYYWSLIGATLLASCVPFGGMIFIKAVDWADTDVRQSQSGKLVSVSIWRNQLTELISIESTGGEIYYVGLAVLGTIALIGAFLAVMPPRRKVKTLEMLECFRYLLKDSDKAYWLIVACESPPRNVV
jgi:cation transport ATPase